ncbi:TOBE domain-containing protein [Leeia sp.]|uniref:TOBE domain-containing protein n=1 Tax=Leeia sp. TaxID=2884678 RepID=UPI0035B437BF
MQAEAGEWDVQGSIWLQSGAQKLGSSLHMALLAQLDDCGSITKAAQTVGLSYKAAWDAINHMNSLAETPLVERLAGGKGGGGTRLTPRGQQLVANFRRIELEHQRFLTRLAGLADGLPEDYQLLRRMTMRTSARNQFAGTIQTLQRGAVNDEVVLDVANGFQLVATITRDSSEALALQPGMTAFALIKASSVLLVSEAGQARFATRNVLPATVAQVRPGAVNAEVSLTLASGHTLIAQASMDALTVQPGQAVTALFQASSVIIGVLG